MRGSGFNNELTTLLCLLLLLEKDHRLLHTDTLTGQIDAILFSIDFHPSTSLRMLIAHESRRSSRVRGGKESSSTYLSLPSFSHQ
jgi:hypothetical protein